MADAAPTPVTPANPYTSVIISAVSGLWGFLTWLTMTLIGYIPVAWLKYIVLAFLGAAMLYILHAYVGIKVPEWKADCPAPVQKVSTLPPLSIYTDIETLKGNQNVMDVRLKALESAKINAQVPPAPAAVPKAKKQKATANAGDSTNSLFAP